MSLHVALGIKGSSMFIKRNNRRLREWWQSPVTIKDRVAGALVGGFGGFWIGVLGRIAIGATPVSLGEVVVCALAAATCCAAIGFVFPKPVTIAFFPLSIFGGGN